MFDFAYSFVRWRDESPLRREVKAAQIEAERDDLLRLYRKLVQEKERTEVALPFSGCLAAHLPN